MTFAENLKRICKLRGTNPTSLCKELGLSTSKVNAWYNGSLPKQEVMISLAEKLECSVMDFFSEGDIHETKKILDSSLSENELEILAYFKLLPEREQIKWIARLEDAAKPFMHEDIPSQDKIS